jgi:hypothetical protein
MTWAIAIRSQSSAQLGSWNPTNPSPTLLSQTLALSTAVPGLCDGLALGTLKPLPVLPQRIYRIGSEQGIVVLAAAMIDRRYRWVVTLEPLITVEIDDVPVVPRKVVDRFGVRRFVEGDRDSEGFGD